MEFFENVPLTPETLALAVFLGITIFAYLVGRLVIGLGRNRQYVRRPLVFGPLTRPIAALLPVFGNTRKELKQDLTRAGYYHPLALAEYLSIRNALVLGWLGLVVTTYYVIVQNNRGWLIPLIVLGTVVGVLLYSIPRLVLQSQAAARLQRIHYSLPDALDMITMSMTGGLPLVRSLELVSGELKNAHPDIACELAIITRQTETRSLELALKQFAERIDIPDVQSLTALVAQTEQLGANVAQAFQDFADGIRRSMRQRAEERGNKTSVKLLLPVVFCLAPPIYILLLAPAVLELRNFVLDENRPGGLLSQSSVANSLDPLTRADEEQSLLIPRSIRPGTTGSP